MSKKISELAEMIVAAAETGMEIEIEQEGVSYKISLSTVIEILKTHFIPGTSAETFMLKTGGDFSGDVSVPATSPTTAFKTRNIKAEPADNDPGVGSPLDNGNVLMIYDV